MKYIIGIDPSITSTGVCLMFDDRPPKFSTEGTKANELDLALRLWHLQCSIWANVPANTQPLLAVVESPISPLALGAHGGKGFNSHIMAYGVIYEMLGKFRIPYVEVAPRVRAVVATGNGNSSKEAVAESFDYCASLGPSTEVNHNEIDAWWLAMIGWEVLANNRTEQMAKIPYGGWLDLSDKAYDAIEKLEIKGKH